MLSTKESLAQFEENLSRLLIQRCTERRVLEGELLLPEELDEMWRSSAAEYMVDAVREFNDYPTVAIAWAAYVGMGAARLWDREWGKHKDSVGTLYCEFRSACGFDLMDEYISSYILGVAVDSDTYEATSDLLLSLSQSSLSLMRGEKIEPSTTDAFYVVASAAKVFFRIGVSIELFAQGYKYRKVTIPMPGVRGQS